MSVILFANNAKSTLAAPINSGDTTVDVAAGTGVLFPNPGANEYFVATFTDVATGLINEIIHVTAVAGDTLTIERAQEGTVALNWTTGDFISNFFTAGSAGAFLQAGQYQQQSANYGVDTGTADALLVSLDPAPASLSAIVGMPVRVFVLNTNLTTSPTLNLNGLGVKNIKAVVSGGVTSVAIGTIAANKICEFVYDGTQFQYNGIIEPATKAQIQNGDAGLMAITPAALKLAFPGAVVGGLNGGKQYLPNGWLYQWGNYNSVGTSPITITFDVAFSAAPRVVCTATQSSGVLPGTPSVISMSSILTTAFTAYSCLWNGSTFVNNTGTSFHWHAIGAAALP